jgi:predicted enzyme related to lactoylglutathione lyase
MLVVTPGPSAEGETAMANLVVHFEIHASDLQKLIAFHSGLLGWTFQKYGGGDQPYWIIDTGEGAIGNAAGEKGLGMNGGLTSRQGPGPEIGAPVNGCNIVVGVDDVDGLVHRGIELGATEALPATDWPGIGRGGYLLDPDGNVFGLISPVLSDGTVAMAAGAGA